MPSVTPVSEPRVLEIHRGHRFIKPRKDQDRIDCESLIAYITKDVETLSPATRRVLDALRRVLFHRFDDLSGYTFHPTATRADIAAEFGRGLLLRSHRVNCLEYLVHCDYVVKVRRVRPCRERRDRVTGRVYRQGSGAEYRYSIPMDTMFCLLWLDPRERGRLEALRRPYEFTLDPEPLPPVTMRQVVVSKDTESPRVPNRLRRWFGR